MASFGLRDASRTSPVMKQRELVTQPWSQSRMLRQMTISRDRVELTFTAIGSLYKMSGSSSSSVCHFATYWWSLRLSSSHPALNMASFLTLPVELRHRIYQILFSGKKLRWLRRFGEGPQFVAIRFVCRQLYEETATAFFHTIRLDITQLVHNYYNIVLPVFDVGRLRKLVLREPQWAMKGSKVIQAMPNLQQVLFQCRSSGYRFRNYWSHISQLPRGQQRIIIRFPWRIVGGSAKGDSVFSFWAPAADDSDSDFGNIELHPKRKPSPFAQSLIDAWISRERSFDLIATSGVFFDNASDKRYKHSVRSSSSRSSLQTLIQ
jgi:hypothetical protein